MGFNYNALDSFEFESLARDVAEKITGVKLSCYTAGADGGVDASDFYYQKGEQRHVAMQAKHWTRYVSPKQWDDLVSSLVKRLKKANKVPTDKLVIVTSAGLTEDAQRRIIDNAESSGINCCIVVDRVKLDDFLNCEENKAILKHHFRLWIAGTNVLSLMLNRSLDIDTKVFLREIEKNKALYAQTSVFDKAIESLGQSSTLLIVGDPGTGKSVLTQMIALQLIKADFKVIYSSCNNIDRIKSAIEDDCENTLFILDDFLGQRCLDVDSSRMRELITLLRYTSKLKNCYVVLNSRISIMNEAKRVDDPFNKYIDSIRAGIVLIDTTEMSLLDKARITLANLSFEKVPLEYVDALRERSSSFFSHHMKCIDLCKHNNFNPRIIEFCCRGDFWKDIDPSEFPAAINNKLDHPNDVWQNEFEERLDQPERILAYQLFSLGDNSIPLSSLQKAYEARTFLEPRTDYSVNTFDRALKRLQETVVRTVYIEGEPYISMANPSVNDYCAWFLANNNLEAIAMARSITFVDQLERITSVNHCPEVVSILRSAFITGQIYDLPFADNKPRPYEMPGYKAICSCEGALSFSDFEWAANFIKNALESPTQKAWSLTASYLFGKSHKWEILESRQILELLCVKPLLSNLLSGTSYDDAQDLYDALIRSIEKGFADDCTSIKQLVCSRCEEWLCEYAIGYLDDWYHSNYDYNLHRRCCPCGDPYEWDCAVRNDAEKQLNEDFDGAFLKEVFAECVGDKLADLLTVNCYNNELDIAIDNVIWNLEVPEQESVFDPYNKPIPPIDGTHESLIVEKLFSDYCPEQQELMTT